MLRIIDLEIVPVAIPFRMNVSHAAAARDHSESLIVIAREESGQAGYGECAPREYVSGETLDSAQRAIEAELAGPWRSAGFTTFEQVVGALDEAQRQLERNQHAAFCALELAVLDLAGKVFGRSAGDVVGTVVTSKARYSGVIATDDPDQAMRLCEACAKMGLASVKLKVGRSFEADNALLQGARKILGDEVSLRVDANGAWTLDEAVHWLESTRSYRIDGVEQPLAADDVNGLAALVQRYIVPVIVDESLVSHADAQALIQARACHMFNIRVSKNGGLIGARRLRDLAVANHIEWMVGAQVGETAILSAAGRHLATRGLPPRWAEGSFGTLLLKEDLAREDLTFGAGGAAGALEGPGLGVTIDDARLAAWQGEPAGQQASERRTP